MLHVVLGLGEKKAKNSEAYSLISGVWPLSRVWGAVTGEAEGGRSRWKVFNLRRGRVEGSEQALWIPTHGDLRLDAE